MNAMRGPESHIQRGPDALTAHLANGGELVDQETAWVSHHLTELRASASSGTPAGDGYSLMDLKRIYLGARVVQGGVIASRLALPAVIDAGQTLRGLRLPDRLDTYAQLGATQTEVFLSGAHQGQARSTNDYPAVVKTYIAAIAGLLNGPYEKAFEQLEAQRPELWNLALDADELQRMCWGHLRWRINEVVPGDEMASYRSRPLQEGTDELLAVIKERTGVALPARVVQRDSQDYIDPRADWQAALSDARQDPRLALLCGIRFSVENAEIATLYGLGSLLMRIRASGPTGVALRQQVRFGVQDIGWGTHLVTHNARFQSRLGARPNYYRSFAEFLRNVRKQIDTSPVRDDGQIDWFDLHAPQKRGWCPAQNQYQENADGRLTDQSKRGHDACTSWTEYARNRFGVTPEYSEPTAGQLLASLVQFALLHDGSPLRPESALMSELNVKLDTACTA